jgi:hypothetical protein
MSHEKIVATSESRSGRDPLIANATLWDGAFPIRYETDTFLLAGPEGIPIEDVGAIAEEAWTLACGLLGILQDCPHLPFLICHDVDELFRLELLLDLPYAADPLRKRRICPGGFYREVPMIAIVDVPTRRMGIAAHEVCHWAVYQLTQQCPLVIGEGLAEYVKHEVLARHPGIHDPSVAESVWIIRDPLLGAVLAQAPPHVQERVMRERASERTPDNMTLRQLFDSADNFEDRQYALSWCLADVLCRMEREQPGSLRMLLNGYKAGGGAWATFASVYDEQRVERLWADRVRGVARGG